MTERPSAARSMVRARAVSGWTKLAALEMNRVLRIARTTDGDQTSAAMERTCPLFAVSYAIYMGHYMRGDFKHYGRKYISIVQDKKYGVLLHA